MSKQKTLYLFPCPIDEHQNETLSGRSIRLLHDTKHFIVERAKTARRFIKTTNPPYSIQELNILELDKHDFYNAQKEISAFLNAHDEIGVISEAGCPGIADPGAEVVKMARNLGFKITPLVGPSSIILSLMASGMNGQDFRFHGYLPVKEGPLKSKLRNIESEILKEKNAHIFIETPYRNQKLFSALLKNINPQIILNISRDLTGEKEYCMSQAISKWKKSKLDLFSDKAPCVFILGQF